MACQILIVEDNPADAKILRFALAQTDPKVETVVCEDGARALDYFSCAHASNAASFCDLVLLDLNLPIVSGFEVLEFLKNDPDLKRIPVVVLSGSSSPEDIERSYQAGANSYICKPTGVAEVMEMAAQILSYWFHQAMLPSRSCGLVRH